MTRRAARLTPGVVRRRPVGVAAASPDAPPPAENILTIARVGDRLVNYPLARANTISLFRSGDEAYPAMLDAIGAARRSIALASYIFPSDRIGMAFIEALREAHRRGVEIRVLVDGIGSGYLVSPSARELRRSPE